MSPTSTDTKGEADDTPYWDGNKLKMRGWLRLLKPHLNANMTGFETMVLHAFYIDRHKTITDTISNARLIADRTPTGFSFAHPALCGIPLPGAPALPANANATQRGR